MPANILSRALLDPPYIPAKMSAFTAICAPSPLAFHCRSGSRLGTEQGQRCHQESDEDLRPVSTAQVIGRVTIAHLGPGATVDGEMVARAANRS